MHLHTIELVLPPSQRQIVTPHVKPAAALEAELLGVFWNGERSLRRLPACHSQRDCCSKISFNLSTVGLSPGVHNQYNSCSYMMNMSLNCQL